MKSKAVTPFYLDKALYVTVLSFLLPLVSAKLGVDLDATKVAGYLVLAISYVVAHKWKSGALLLKELELEALKLAQQKLGPDPLPAAKPYGQACAEDGLLAQGLASSGALKAFAALAVVGCLFGAAPARAQWIASAGPTMALTELRPGVTHPLSVAPNFGVQLSFTRPEFQRAINGRAWDLLDLNLMLFGSLINADAAGTFAVLSPAVGICTMSSLLCLGGGHDALATGGFKPNWFAVFALSINFAGSPTSPPAGTASGTAGMLRGNTIYYGGW